MDTKMVEKKVSDQKIRTTDPSDPGATYFALSL
jgi:hypothetical protein